ncbi:MAG: hypothetical protein KME35_10805 [Aphanocapsa sp. GSE-SYN-MK-11-07L]|jgi:hypothetical protein|nr:hypothetical protein [Aphanocapsa sp. GSE-SYN-MK-11-07L]
MQASFEKFKARYIVLDFILITFFLAILIAVFFISQGFTTEDLNKNKSIWVFACSCLLTICLCYATAFRLKKSGINLKYLFGETSVNRLPWLMLFTIFFGIRVLQSGISQLTIFILNLISPEWAETALKNANSSFSLNSNTDSLYSYI